uniref:Uncharacterized protein n=1 Tax=Arundo donax TaxID=35708 RepID=A0A0A8YIX5_ARUDO
MFSLFFLLHICSLLRAEFQLVI